MAQITPRKNKDGTTSYTIRASIGYDSYGKQLTKSTTWKPTAGLTPAKIQKELEKYAIAYEERVQNGNTINENITFSEYSKLWLSTAEMDLAPMTIKGYKTIMANCEKAIGYLKLSKMQPTHLKQFYKYLSEERHLQSTTILHYHRFIAVVLSTACREGFIAKNITTHDYMNAPKVQKKEAIHLDDIQAKHFVDRLQYEEDIRIRAALALLIYSGVRLGELCGLEWQDIDFDNNIIHIRRTSQFIKGQGTITKLPKNITSQRTIKLAPYMFKTLRVYKSYYMEQRIASGDRWINSNRLFIQDNGKPITPTTINKWLNRFTDKYDLPRIHPHSLRHTFATLLILNGVDIKTTSAKLGHSRTSTTLDIYTHAVKTADEQASKVLDDLLTPKIMQA